MSSKQNRCEKCGCPNEPLAVRCIHCRHELSHRKAVERYCWHCGKAKKSLNEQGICPDCVVLKQKAESKRKASPWLKGVSSGPGSCSNESIFDRPDPAKDIPLTLKRMEADGKLRDPHTMWAAKVKFDEAKRMPHSKIDYQKSAHPLDN